MASVSIIGAGNVGLALGLLFKRNGHTILDICNRSVASAEKAAKVIGSGKPIAGFAEMRPADILMVTTNDNALQTIAFDIVDSSVTRHGTIVFHCSGATPSAVLAPLRDKGAIIASIHPVKTFTNPISDADHFSGTWCGIEGDAEALAVLRPLFESFGATCFAVKSDSKTLYHTAIVFACNYLFPVIEAGLRCYEEAGVSREISAQILTPIMHATVDNAVRLGPGKAITGPIARGDDKIVKKHLEAVAAFDPDLKTLYEVIGSFATNLALEKGVAPIEKIREIRHMLNYDHYIRPV